MNHLVGKQLKDYAVLRRLGRGAMAEVYLAQQLSLGRPVALKVLNGELARDPTYVERFHHEARAAAALVHRGIVQIYEVGQAEGVHFIAQEYVPGRNLGEVIRSRGRLECGLALDILRQVASALAKAAAEGIVHRDIKPENILVAAASGEVKVADFGLARVQGDGGLNLTQIGLTMGTPLYMSPEQIEGRPLDSRSDIYSLGVTAYHMLSGVPPYEGDTPLAVAVQHLNQPAPPLASRRPEVPEGVAALVHRMLAKRPADRFADPSELLGALHALIQQGVEEGWARGGEPWSLGEWMALADERAAATARLDEAMKAGRLARATRSVAAGRIAAGRIAALVAASILVGALLGFAARPRSLLAGATNGPARLESVWAQLYHAKTVDTEAAWLAVEQLFPDADDYYKNLAKQGLAQYYLFTSQQFDQAIRPLTDLANLGASNRRLEAFGIAGLVVAHARLGNAVEARNQNGRLSSEQRALVRDRMPQLADALDEALRQMEGDRGEG